jgi:hypothetical protein
LTNRNKIKRPTFLISKQKILSEIVDGREHLLAVLKLGIKILVEARKDGSHHSLYPRFTRSMKQLKEPFSITWIKKI